MNFISCIKRLKFDMVVDKTIKLSIYTGSLSGTVGGIHGAYNFTPDKSENISYNSMCLMAQVIKDTYLYGMFGLVNGIIWPISIRCWTISTIKYIKTP